MTREEREMDIWQRAYEHPMLMDPKTKAAAADAALAAFREAFPNDPPKPEPHTGEAFPITPDSGTWSRPGEP